MKEIMPKNQIYVIFFTGFLITSTPDTACFVHKSLKDDHSANFRMKRAASKTNRLRTDSCVRWAAQTFTAPLTQATNAQPFN